MNGQHVPLRLEILPVAPVHGVFLYKVQERSREGVGLIPQCGEEDRQPLRRRLRCQPVCVQRGGLLRHNGCGFCHGELKIAHKAAVPEAGFVSESLGNFRGARDKEEGAEAGRETVLNCTVRTISAIVWVMTGTVSPNAAAVSWQASSRVSRKSGVGEAARSVQTAGSCAGSLMCA
uniref:Ig-like domain-containing protein n=1 Tax=Odontella aurita TaxID=265563 RepID=A0A7S4JGB8_9STRA